MGRCSDVVPGVMQNQVLELDEFAVDSEGGAGITEMGSFNPSAAGRRTGDPLVETYQCGPHIRNGP
jgi:hypothetical protein